MNPHLEPPGNRRGRRTVLVIDDEYGARLQVALALLTSQRLRVVGEATNGRRGAERAEELQPDIVVLDLSMPIMDGFEAIPLIRRLCPRASIVVRTADPSTEHQRRATALGVDAFLPKLQTPDELQLALERVADDADRRRSPRACGTPRFEQHSRTPLRDRGPQLLR